MKPLLRHLGLLFLPLLGLVSLSLPTIAQDWGTIEEMEEVLAQKDITPEQRVDAKLTLAEAYLYSFATLPERHAAQCTQNIQQALALAQQHNYTGGIVKSQYCRGMYYARTRRYDSAALCFDSAYATAYPTLPHELAHVYYGKGYLALKQREYEQALPFFHKAAASAQQLEMWRLEARASESLGACYRYNGDYTLAMQYFKLAESQWYLGTPQPYIPRLYYYIALMRNVHTGLSEKLKYLNLADEQLGSKGDSSLRFYVHMGKSSIYNDLQYQEEAKGHAFEALHLAKSPREKGMAMTTLGITVRDLEKDYEAATHYFKQAIAFAEAAGSEPGIVIANLGQGICEYQLGSPQAAIKHLEIAKKLTTPGASNYYVAAIDTYLGESHRKLGNYQEAIYHIENGLSHANTAGEYRVKHSSLAMAKTYQELHNYQKAYAYHRLYAQMNDSLAQEKDKALVIRHQIRKAQQWKHDSLAMASQMQSLQTQANKRQQQWLTFFWALGLVLGLGLVVTFGLLLRMKT